MPLLAERMNLQRMEFITTSHFNWSKVMFKGELSFRLVLRGDQEGQEAFRKQQI